VPTLVYSGDRHLTHLHSFPTRRSSDLRADPCFLDGSQLLKRVGRRPHVTSVESRLVAEAEQAIPDLEFLCVLEEADHVAISRIGWHTVPELWRQARRVGFDDGMDPFAHGAIRRRHRRDFFEYRPLLA